MCRAQSTPAKRRKALTEALKKCFQNQLVFAPLPVSLFPHKGYSFFTPLLHGLTSFFKVPRCFQLFHLSFAPSNAISERKDKFRLSSIPLSFSTRNWQSLSLRPRKEKVSLWVLFFDKSQQNITQRNATLIWKLRRVKFKNIIIITFLCFAGTNFNWACKLFCESESAQKTSRRFKAATFVNVLRDII